MEKGRAKKEPEQKINNFGSATLQFTATSSSFPSFSLNKHMDVATLLASVYITKLSFRSGIVNLKFIVEIA